MNKGDDYTIDVNKGDDYTIDVNKGDDYTIDVFYKCLGCVWKINRQDKVNKMSC